MTNLTTEGVGGASCCVLPGCECSRVNNKNALPVITVAVRKWASPPLPVPGGGEYTGTVFEFSARVKNAGYKEGHGNFKARENNSLVRGSETLHA